MKLNGGKGSVILKKQKLVNKVCEKVAAIRHFNGTDVWVVTHEWGTNRFCSFLLNSSGLNTIPINSFCGRIQLPLDTTDDYPAEPYPECASRGYMKFSPQGNRLVVFSTSDCHVMQSYPELFTFNNTSGSITYNYVINTADSTIYYGGSFSPNGNLLYASGAWYGRYIHQFDLTSNNSTTIPLTKYIVFEDTTYTGPYQAYALQIGPNGKIYCAANNNYLHVINSPNTYGNGCNLQLMGQPLGNCDLSSSALGLPNNDETFYLNSFVGNTCSSDSITDFIISDSCSGTPISFFDGSNFYPLAVNNWKWDFGDPSSGALNKSILKNPQHTFSNIGTYQVKMIAYSDTFYYCKKDSITKTLHINCNTTGINKLVDNSNINIYPNPNNGSFVIEPNSSTKQIMQVYDVNSKIVLSQTINGKTTIDASSLPEGVYNISLQSSEDVVNKRMVIVR